MRQLKIGYIIVFVLFCVQAHSQITKNFSSQYGNRNSSQSKDSTGQQLEHRDPNEDSITISYHYFDSTKTFKLDSSISDFYQRYPISYNYADLGNFGNAAQPLIFSPYMKPGWDAGFHAYDPYKFTVENTKLYTSTRPYTELAYMLGSKSEQMVDVMHTQNRKSNLNFSFGYRLINAPGTFRNQNTNHNNLRVAVSYQSTNKRYSNNFIYINNKLRSSENGGVKDEATLAQSETFSDPFQNLVRLGNAAQLVRNPFSVQIKAGSLYDESILLFRQNYDLGQKDSVVTDSVTYRLFYPRIRFQYTINYTKQNYVFMDQVPEDSLYMKYYNIRLFKDTVEYRDLWNKLTNDFSIISYPEKNNLNQFLKLGAGYEMIAGGGYDANVKYNNIYFTGEYRNRTRNQKWDLVISGRLYGTGEYAGDYDAYIALQRELSKKTGNLQIGFENVNRSPSAIFKNGITSFPVFTDGQSFNKENISKAFAAINLKAIDLSLVGDYYIISNYTYLHDFFDAAQESTLFNVLHIGATKKVQVAKHWNWYIEAHLQQTTGNPPVNLPLFLTRQRFAFEGNFFTNLFLSTGIEVQYNTPYNADSYSPLNGQFFYQNDFSTDGNRPQVNAYFNFRIKSFKGFVRGENINTINQSDKYKFTRYNFTSAHYPQRPFWFRVGIWWNFVN